MFLVVVADVDVGAKPDHAPVRCDRFVEDTQDRGFAGPVVADQSHVFAASDLEGDPGKQSFVTVGFGEVLDGENFAPALDAGGKSQVHIVTQFYRFLDDLRTLQHLLAALRTPYGFFAVEPAELFDDFFLVADLRLVVHVSVVLLLPERFLALGIYGIIASEERALSVLDLNDLCDGPVKEIAVVRDDEHCSFIVHQIGLEPADAVHVEMVGGLVEHKKVRLLKQEFTQGDSCFLPSGERGYFLFEFRGRKAEAF